MKIKNVRFTQEQIDDMLISLWDGSNEIPICSVNNWDVQDMNKQYSDYINHKGKIFEHAIKWHNECKVENFLIHYLSQYEGMVEYDEGHLYLQIAGFTATRKSTRDELKKFLKKFERYSRIFKTATSVEECNNCLFLVDQGW